MRDFLLVAFCHLPDGLARIGLDLLAVEFELDLGHSAASFGTNSSGKYLITDVSGFEAACPSPQIEASRIARLSWSSSSRFQTGRSIRIAAFSVPTRHRLHSPPPPSSKPSLRFPPPPLTLSCPARLPTP